METIKEKVDKQIKEVLDNKIKPWFWYVGLGLLITPFVLTQKWITIIDFSETGEVGDTIGGTLGPLVALIGAILVYISFREQYRTNLLQWEALEEEKRIRKDEQEERKIEDNQNLIWKLIDDIQQQIYHSEIIKIKKPLGMPRSYNKIANDELEYDVLNESVYRISLDLYLALSRVSNFNKKQNISTYHYPLFFQKLKQQSSTVSDAYSKLPSSDKIDEIIERFNKLEKIM